MSVRIPSREMRETKIHGGIEAPFVLTIHTWKRGTVRVEMSGYGLSALADQIAKALREQKEATERLVSCTAQDFARNIAGAR